MICRIRAGSLTTDSLAAIGLRPATSASVTGSVTVQPLEHEVASFLVYEHGRAVVAIRARVHAGKA